MLSPSWFQLLSSPPPRPTGLLKMKKVQGDCMFNAGSHLLPLRPFLLSHTNMARCKRRQTPKSQTSSQILRARGGQRKRRRQSWHMKAVFEACYTGNDRFKRLHTLWGISVFWGWPGALYTLFSHTIERDQDNFIYEDGWLSLKPLSSEQFPK